MNAKLFFILFIGLLSFNQFQAQLVSIKFEEINVNKIRELIRKGASCVDLIKMFIDRIHSIDSYRINSIIQINQYAYEDAMELDDYYAKNSKYIGRLHCVPVLIKDNIDVEGVHTTAGMNVFRNSLPSKDATVVQRLRDQGAILIAKTNMAMFATGSETSETGDLCKNPYDRNRTCGPSSTGSGAGLAALFGLLALGTDTLGSAMYPASYNSLFGLRPAQDEIELDGVMPLFKKQDTICPLARCMDDLALTYFTIGNKLDKYELYLNPLVKPPNELKVVTFTNFLTNFDIQAGFTKLSYVIDPAVKQELANTTANLRKLNIRVNEQTLDQAKIDEFKAKISAVPIQQLAGCDLKCMKFNMNQYLSRLTIDSPYKNFGDLVRSPLLIQYFKTLFETADYISSSLEDDCKQACTGYDSAKADLKTYILKWFDDGVDAVLFPTSGVLPYENGKPISEQSIVGPTLIASYSGLASISIPVAFSKLVANGSKGLPIGMLLLTTSEKLFNAMKIAKHYEAAYLKANLPQSVQVMNGEWFRRDETSPSMLRLYDNYIELYKLG